MNVPKVDSSLENSRMRGKSDASLWNSDESRKVKRLMGFYEFEVFRGKSAFYADVPRVQTCAKMRH